MLKDARTEILKTFQTFMSRETMLGPRDVAWATSISHETIYQFLSGKRPSIIHASQLVEFMLMIHEMRKILRPLVEKWHNSSPRVIVAAFEKIEVGDVPQNFIDIMLADGDVGKKSNRLLASILQEKKKREESMSCDRLRDRYQELKELTK